MLYAIKAALFAIVIAFAAPAVAQNSSAGANDGYLPAELHWMLDRAEQGDAEIQTWLGRLYERGLDGAPQLYAEAAKWYRRAADQDYPPAQVRLGWLYEYGNGVPQDYVQSYIWFYLGGDSFGAEGVAQRLTPEQIAEAKRRALAWRPFRRPGQGLIVP